MVVCELDHCADFLCCERAAGSHEAIVPDFHEAVGQYVLQESAHELEYGQRRFSFFVCSAGCVREGHDIVFDGDDAAVADGNAKDAGCQISEDPFGVCSDGLHIDAPLSLPCFPGYQVEETLMLHQVAEFCFEQR